MRNILMTAAALAALAVSGCAMPLYGTHEKVTIATMPEGALCKIYRDSEGFIKEVNTPGAKYIRRSPEAIRVVCSKRGYKDAVVEVEARARGEIIANAATFGAALLPDLASGAPYELPEKIEIELTKARQ